jgi:hypothetical protein
VKTRIGRPRGPGSREGRCVCLAHVNLFEQVAVTSLGGPAGSGRKAARKWPVDGSGQSTGMLGERVVACWLLFVHPGRVSY